jgi:aspartate racemase
MARRIESEQVDPADVLVPLQTAGTLPALICVHPIDGDVMRFAQLARELGNDQPFYGLRAPGLFDRQACYDDVSQLARLYASRLRKAFSGPFYLAGFSFGGIVAVETARALQELGERVAFVGLLDASAPGFSLADGLRMLPADAVAYAQHKLRMARSQGWRAALLVKDLLETIGEFSSEHLAVAMAHRRALRRARPKPFRGKVVVFRARARRLFSSHSASLGWSRLACGGAEVRMVSGMHEEIFVEPHVRTLATELRKALANARTEAGAG